MGLLSRSWSENKTSSERSPKTGLLEHSHPPPSMPPWLLPVLVTVSMVVFLVISFSLHHRRFVQQRHRTSQYYILRYHRVAGPIFSFSSLGETPGNSDIGHDDEEADKLTNIPSSCKLKGRLGRFNTWSPRILKSKVIARFVNKNNKSEEKCSYKSIRQVLDELATQSRDGNTDIVSRLDAMLGRQSSLPTSEIMSLADITGLARSYSCRMRPVVVTTSSGTLAIAKHDPESSDMNTNCHSPSAPPLVSNQNLSQELNKSGIPARAYSPDLQDAAHNPRSGRESHPPLARYLEDDDPASPIIPASSLDEPTTSVISSRDSTNTGTIAFLGFNPGRRVHERSSDEVSSGETSSVSSVVEKPPQAIQSSFSPDIPPALQITNSFINQDSITLERQNPISSYSPSFSESHFGLSTSQISSRLFPGLDHDAIAEESFTDSTTSLSTWTKPAKPMDSLRNITKVTNELLMLHTMKSSCSHQENSVEPGKKTKSMACQMCLHTTAVIDTLRDSDLENVRNFLIKCEQPENSTLSTCELASGPQSQANANRGIRNRSRGSTESAQESWDETMDREYLEESIESLHNFVFT